MCLVFEKQIREWKLGRWSVHAVFYPDAQVPWYKLPFRWKLSRISLGYWLPYIELSREFRYDICEFKRCHYGWEATVGRKNKFGIHIAINNLTAIREFKNDSQN